MAETGVLCVLGHFEERSRHLTCTEWCQQGPEGSGLRAVLYSTVALPPLQSVVQFGDGLTQYPWTVSVSSPQSGLEISENWVLK